MKKQVILITGASSGMGKVTALQLINEGHIVYGAARRVEAMQELVAAGGHALAMDVTQEGQVHAAVEKLIREQDRIDVLINNAGFGLYGAIEDISIEEAKYQFEVNLFGLARLTQKVLPYMRRQKSGKIINISSMGGKIYTPLGAWYHATKHALEGWSDCLRIEVKSFGIDVVIVEPGAIATAFGDVLTEPMLKRSGAGPYQGLARAVAKTTTDAYQKKNAASPPGAIAKVIAKAIRSHRPKTRYVAGKMARPLILTRKYLGDRVFDYLLLSMMK